jgi:hypothetical protein
MKEIARAAKVKSAITPNPAAIFLASVRFLQRN